MTVVLESVMTHRHGVETASKLGDPPSVIANSRYGADVCAVPPLLLNIFIPVTLKDCLHIILYEW